MAAINSFYGSRGTRLLQKVWALQLMKKLLWFVAVVLPVGKVVFVVVIFDNFLSIFSFITKVTSRFLFPSELQVCAAAWTHCGAFLPPPASVCFPFVTIQGISAIQERERQDGKMNRQRLRNTEVDRGKPKDRQTQTG